MTNAEWVAVVYEALGITAKAGNKRHRAITMLDTMATGIALRNGYRYSADSDDDVALVLDTILSVAVRARVDEILYDPDAPQALARKLGSGNDLAEELYRQVIVAVRQRRLEPRR